MATTVVIDHLPSGTDTKDVPSFVLSTELAVQDVSIDASGRRSSTYQVVGSEGGASLRISVEKLAASKGNGDRTLIQTYFHTEEVTTVDGVVTARYPADFECKAYYPGFVINDKAGLLKGIMATVAVLMADDGATLPTLTDDHISLLADGITSVVE